MENMQVSWWKLLCDVQRCVSIGFTAFESGLKVFVLCADAKLRHVPSLDKHVACCTLANINTLSVKKQLSRKPRPEIQSINHRSNFVTVPKQWAHYLYASVFVSLRQTPHQKSVFCYRLHIRTHRIVRISDIYNEYLKTARGYIWHGLLIKCWWLHRLYLC